MRRIFISLLMLCISITFTNTAKAEDTNLTGVDNVIYVASSSAVSGETATLSICMKNTAPIRGFQFNLYLPDGVTPVKNSKGKIQTSLSTERLDDDDDHTLSASEQSDGSILFLCGSEYPENFNGNEGEVATLKINVSADVISGAYPILLKNIKLSETDISKYYLTELIESTLIVMSGSTSINVLNGDAKSKEYYDLQGRKIEKPSKGLYITNGRKLIVK